MNDTAKEPEGAPRSSWAANYRKAKERLFEFLGRVAFWTAVFSAAALLSDPSPAAFAAAVLIGLGTGLLLDRCAERLLGYLDFRMHVGEWPHSCLDSRRYGENMRKGPHDKTRSAAPATPGGLETPNPPVERGPKTSRVLAFSACRAVANDPVRENPCFRTCCWKSVAWTIAE